jgi:membrane protease YdiL (CAAX protease family)
MKTTSEASGLQIAFLTLVANFVSIPLGSLIARASGLDSFHSTISQALIFILAAIALTAFPEVRRRAAAYLCNPILRTRRRELLAVIVIDVSLVSLAIGGAIAAWSFAMNGIEGLRPLNSPETELSAALSSRGLAHLFLAIVLAPTVEELVFRGFLLDAWRRRFGWTIASILTSAVFAAYHPLFLVAFVQSLILIFVLRRTGTLRGPIVLHTCTNLSLWYPLVGQYAFPSNPEGGIGVWLPNFASLLVVAALLPWYAWLAWTRPAHDTAFAGNQTRL